MNNSSKFLSLFLAFIVGGFAIGCKTTDKTTTKKTDKTETVVSTDTEETPDTTSPLNKLNKISGSNVTTTSVEENASGMDKELPFDGNVRTGTLENGMKYYIRKNAKPENRIELRLALNAGSMQEEDNQRGLAHFVEHMCFNGTKHFEKNALVDFLESTGVRFGADLNAYTSFDETVYMLQIPTDKEGLVDKGLLVMSDWATGVSMDSEEIDKERGVIESEWRTRLGASERMRQTWWPKVFYKTRYAQRLPIGTMEVIKKSPYERLRTFYKDWYRPNLQALVVVGDLDLDEMEAKIKEKFSVLKNPEVSREKESSDVPDHDETFVAIATDKEATNSTITMYTKHDPMRIKTLDDYRTTLLHGLYNGMLGERFDEIAQDKDAPFLNAGAGYGGFVRAKDSYYASATAKEKGLLESLQILLKEHARVLQHGFTETELERQKLSMLKSAERQFKERDKITSGRLAMECVYHFLQAEPMFGAEKDLQLTKEFLPTIKLEEINALAKKWIIEKNRAIVVQAPEKEGVVIPTEEQIRAELDKFKTLKVEAYKDKFLDLPLLAKEPTAGKVVETKEIKDNDLNITEFKLSNGVRVVLKPTEFQNDQILLRSFSPGGHSIYSDKDYPTAANAASIIDESGIGEFDLISLEKKLTANTVGLTPFIGEMYEGFNGSSSVEDFEILLKLVHLYATAPRKDKDAFERYIDQSKEQVRNLMSNPMYYFYDQLVSTQNGKHPRRKMIPTEEDMDNIDYARAFEIYKDRFSDFSDFTFVFVGNFEVDKAKPLFEKYLGSLPSTNRKENWKDIGVTPPVNGATNAQKKGVAPQANVYVGFIVQDEWTREKAHHVSSMSKVLSIMVRENLREDKGGVYSPSVGGGFSKKPKGQSGITVIFQCAPEDVDDLVAAVKEEIKDLQKNGPSEENFVKIREQQRRGFETDTEKNSFWAGALSSYYQDGRNPKDILTYPDLIEKLTKEDIKKAANTFMDLDKAIIVTVKPEKVTEERP
ncbi:MAG: insulinase family protein [Aureispira sp.]|nr:insulinase family protein [Aureispira sp.]